MVVPNGSFDPMVRGTRAVQDEQLFTIQASKNGHTITTVRIRPTVCVEKAKTLLQEGWQVHITDAAGIDIAPMNLIG